MARAMSMSFAWAVVKDNKIMILTILTTCVLLYDITLSMLAYLLLAILTQKNFLSAIFPYVQFCLATGQEHRHSSIRSPSTFYLYVLY